jgi:lipoate-protein ligase B
MSGLMHVVDLGRRAYQPVLELQRELCRRRMAGALTEDLLLLVEHEPVVTLGRGTREASLPLSRPEMARQGFEVVEVERGGDVTVHEPGQLVGYPIFDLTRHRQDLHWYLRQLEGALIEALGGLGIPSDRNPGLTGVWTGGRKIASLGIHVKQWITFHGFALNVINDLRGFNLVVPCGIQDVTMTSVARERPDLGLEASDTWTATRTAVIRAMGASFGLLPVETDGGNLADLADVLAGSAERGAIAR